jgi:dTDP-4-dehydrorhamnose 3,5-epimerase
MSQIDIKPCALPGLFTVHRKAHADDRGYFERLFCAETLEAAGWHGPIVHVNRSLTIHPGTVRGMHMQLAPHTEMKLVMCTRGELLDVAVDMRKGSPTFLQWHAEKLSADNGVALLVPEGYAHGFQALVPDVELVYCNTRAYAPGSEAGLHPLDPRVGIDWALPVSNMSPKDAERAFLDESFTGFDIPMKTAK